MEFDFIIGNPAFNISEDNNIAGTGGNTILYKKASKHAVGLLKPNGILMFITLKGIISELYNGHFRDYHVHSIDLMDNIDVWNYNTCFFILENTKRKNIPKITGGEYSKIFTIDDNEKFPFVYYSGSNNGMNKFFDNGSNKVIRKLPSKSNNNVEYDYTNKIIDRGPKFAFNVMESSKSYTVTDEPIYGGTICYIPTNTLEEAEKIKAFTKFNPAFFSYVQRMKLKYHAFSLRNIKKFDLKQIQTGREIPIEWDISNDTILTIKNEISIDKDRVKTLGEVFTPKDLVNITLDRILEIKPDAFSNTNYTFCDTMCGTGNFLVEILNRKLKNGIDVDTALSTIYGVDIMEDNINTCRHRLFNNDIVQRNVICANTFKFGFHQI